MAPTPTMKNFVAFHDEQGKFRTELEDLPALNKASLKSYEVLIKVNVAGSTPKDYKHPLPQYFNNRLNQGDDCAGTVAGFGSAVKGWVVGERVVGYVVPRLYLEPIAFCDTR